MKKIMFNDRYGLTEAVLQGRKTMTRRIVPQSLLDRVKPYQQEYYDGTLDTITEQDAILNMFTGERMLKTAPQLGEAVAVAQSYHSILDEMFANDYTSPIYDPFRSKKPDLEEEKGWTNKMFVKAELMPHRIRITDIKVERLQDITRGDCLREGIQPVYEEIGHVIGCTFPNWKCGDKIYTDSREAFSALIDKVSGRGTWDRNPWVFAYSFELIK
jgi:hypothetical protein